MSEQKTTYHWLIVAACFCLTAVSIGILVNCWAILAPALMEKFKDVLTNADGVVVRGPVERIFMIAALLNLIGSAVVGKIMGKFTMRITMPIYAILMSGGIFMWSLSNTLTMYYISAIFVGLGASGIAVIPCGALLNNWFEEKKGLAIGIAFTGSGAGGLILVQLSSYMLNVAKYDLQTTYLALAIIAAAISIPITLFIVREHPRDKGLVPYGSTGKTSSGQLSLPGITLKQYIKTGSFWFLAIAVFIISFINVGLQNHLPAIMGKLESSPGVAVISPKAAANIFTLYLFLLIPTKILLGFIYDKAGIAFSTIYCVIAYLATAGILFYYGNMPAESAALYALYVAIAAAVVFSLVSAMSTVTPPYVTAKIVGLKDFTTIYGILNLFYGIGLIVGPGVAAKIYDANGSYSNVFYVFGALAIVLCLATILSAKKGEGYSQTA
jgi:sugar phosphate permease